MANAYSGEHRRIGEAILAGTRFGGDSSPLYVLFGDPAMVLDGDPTFDAYREPPVVADLHLGVGATSRVADPSDPPPMGPSDPTGPFGGGGCSVGTSRASRAWLLAGLLGFAWVRRRRG